MKFTHSERSVDTSKARAFIDEDGDLVVICKQSDTGVCLRKLNACLTYTWGEVREALKKARQVFFEGDEVTITF